MQPKVSIVMPCYNKVNYIVGMFESILAQKWDNIEIVLVNDGSTDGTYETIVKYKDKFRNRGYDVKIINQKNSGVCAAAKAGLSSISGEFVCVIDSDDELSSEYVSVMATWLSEHNDYDYVMCTYTPYTYNESGEKIYKPVYQIDDSKQRGDLTERYLLMDFPRVVWVYMLRTAYLKKCGIVNSYFCETKESHEPGFVIPLHAYGGKMKFINQPLYYFDATDEITHHSVCDSYEGYKTRYNEYARLQKIAVEALDKDVVAESKKIRLIQLAELNRIKSLYRVKLVFDGESSESEALLTEYISSLNKFGLPFSNHHIQYISCEKDILFVEELILGIRKRIIGHGALGTRGKKFLPQLRGRIIEPTELWDKDGDGAEVKKPDFASLTEQDLVLIFPVKPDVVEDICDELDKVGFTNYLKYHDIIKNYFMPIYYIIVQAGGKGTRLEHLTANKPKAIVPIENLPILFRLFRKFPNHRFIIIADYQKDVLRKYLEAFAEVKYQIVESNGSGTCGGIGHAIELLPPKTAFMLIWSDLILADEFTLPTIYDNYVGVSQTFPCRWKYEDGELSEENSTEYGVAGLFVFKNKSFLNDVPQSGEFVRYLRNKSLAFSNIGLAGTKEFGTLAEYSKLETIKTRPFNKMTFYEDRIIKEPVDEQGERLAGLECKWYEYAKANGVCSIPATFNTNPLTMEKINGKSIYEYYDLSIQEKRDILRKLVDSLKHLHSLKDTFADTFSIKNAYYTKTMERLSKIRDMIPFAEQQTIVVNGRVCKNVYYYKHEFEQLLDQVKCGRFAFIHGDCTFSNLMLRNNGDPVFIDPRGYFGYTELFGDPNYDWAKLYYSVVGNYDRFNLKDFRLAIGETDVELKIKSNQWEELEQDFFDLSGTDKQTIRLLHAVIWLSLTTYAWQDYDSICGAFYNGLYYLEECWQ